MSFLLPAFNEERHIEAKLNNLFELQASQIKVQIIVGSDGSKDNTPQLINAWIDKHPEVEIIFIDEKVNQGKWSLLKKLIEKASGDYLVLSDISALLPADFLLKLERVFLDPEVAVYAPTYAFLGKTKKKFWEKLYWPLEHFIREKESEWFSTIGAHGACYALKKCYLVNLEELEEEGHAPINDDFVLPTFCSIIHEKKIVYDRTCVAMEIDSATDAVEYKRRLRIARGNFAMNRFLMGRFPLNRYPKFYFLFFSHKVTRSLIGPISFLGFFFLTIFPWGDLRYNVLGIFFCLVALAVSPLRASIQVYFLENRGKKKKSWS